MVEQPKIPPPDEYFVESEPPPSAQWLTPRSDLVGGAKQRIRREKESWNLLDTKEIVKVQYDAPRHLIFPTDRRGALVHLSPLMLDVLVYGTGLHLPFAGRDTHTVIVPARAHWFLEGERMAEIFVLTRGALKRAAQHANGAEPFAQTIRRAHTIFDLYFRPLHEAIRKETGLKPASASIAYFRRFIWPVVWASLHKA